jgi:D-alanine transaminase
MTPIAHFNGQLLPLDQIHISPLDRGFIFGDGVYEVIPAYDGAMLRAREHFERLQRSMDEIRLRNPHTVASGSGSPRSSSSTTPATSPSTSR